MTTAGLLLAAGAGSRMGRPKALVGDADGPWLPRGVRTLLDGGCDDVTVVLGAAVCDAVELLDGMGVDTVVAHDWADGMSASLRAGLTALEGGQAGAAVVHLVDLPDVGPDVVRRLLAAATGPESLARASYDGLPGHPVLMGRGHWRGIVETAAGDQGAKAYLKSHDTWLIECSDLATGEDVDSFSG